jgi:hypothetical protein
MLLEVLLAVLLKEFPQQTVTFNILCRSLEVSTVLYPSCVVLEKGLVYLSMVYP